MIRNLHNHRCSKFVTAGSGAPVPIVCAVKLLEQVATKVISGFPVGRIWRNMEFQRGWYMSPKVCIGTSEEVAGDTSLQIVQRTWITHFLDGLQSRSRHPQVPSVDPKAFYICWRRSFSEKGGARCPCGWPLWMFKDFHPSMGFQATSQEFQVVSSRPTKMKMGCWLLTKMEWMLNPMSFTSLIRIVV